MIFNKLGGYQYQRQDEKDRAKKADLVTLPPMKPNGATCSNCLFANQNVFQEDLFCVNENVQLPVRPIMCCSFWKNPKQINSWEKV